MYFELIEFQKWIDGDVIWVLTRKQALDMRCDGSLPTDAVMVSKVKDYDLESAIHKLL